MKFAAPLVLNYRMLIKIDREMNNRIGPTGKQILSIYPYIHAFQNLFCHINVRDVRKKVEGRVST